MGLFETLKRNSPKLFYFKAIFAFLLSLSFFLYRFLKDKPNLTCIFDRYHSFTSPINMKLEGGLDNILIGIGQVLMDGWIVFSFIIWFFKVKNGRFPVAAASFFLVRITFLAIIKLPFPSHMIWHSPGFISLTVPYDRTRDFFYSGHTGTLVLIMYQFFANKYGFITIMCLISLLYMVNLLAITRVHYSADIVGGFIFATFFFSVAQKQLVYIDSLLSLPYLLAIKIYRRYQKNKYKSADEDLKTEISQQLIR